MLPAESVYTIRRSSLKRTLVRAQALGPRPAHTDRSCATRAGARVTESTACEPRATGSRQGRKVEVLRFAPSTAQTLDARVGRLDPARRGLRPTRRAYLYVGAQALNERLGGACARAAPRQAGVRPIQRLDSGPPAPLSQPHGGCRSCARQSQTREAEAADSARGPRGVEAARETGRG